MEKKTFEGGESTVFLIVTWVLLREINKYELETCYGIKSKLFMSWEFLHKMLFLEKLVLNSK